MILPNEAEIVALRAYALQKFACARPLVVQLPSPIDAALVVVPFDLASFKAHRDLRCGPDQTAHSSAVVTRTIWCSPQAVDLRPGHAATGATVGGGGPLASPTIDTFQPSATDPDPIHRIAVDRTRALCASWPAADEKVATALEDAAGWVNPAPTTQLLDPAAPPPGLSSAEAVEMLKGKPATGPGSLWAVTTPGPAGMSLVMSAPSSQGWHASQAAYAAAVTAGKGLVETILLHAKPRVVWAAGGFDAVIAERPGFAAWLNKPLAEMGGASSRASSFPL